MKSKQRLAKVAALALVLGFSGIYGAMADEIRMNGVSKTIENNTVKGAWLQNKSTLTANNVTFVDDPTNLSGKGEVAIDGGSTLNMTGGAIKVADDCFTVEEGSTANITNAEVTSGAFANNASITMTNSTISGGTLYAGDKWENDAPLPLGKVNDQQPGKLQVNGGTVNVALIWGQASWKGDPSNEGEVYFGEDAEVTVNGTEGLKLPDGKVLTGIYATEHGTVRFNGAKKADISEIHADDDSVVKFSNAADVKTGDVYLSNDSVLRIWDTPKAAIGNVYISSNSWADIADVSEIDVGNVKVVGEEKASGASAQVPINDDDGNAVSFYGKTNANVKNIDLSNGAGLFIGEGTSVKAGKLTSDYSYLYMDLGDMSDGKPSLTANELSLNNGSEIVCDSQDAQDGVGHEAAGKFTLGRLNVNNSKINFGQEASVNFDNKLAEDSGLYVSNGGSASVADGGTLNAKSVQVSGNKSTFVQQGKSNAAVSSLAINQGGTASITGGAEAKVDNLTIQNASLDLGNGTNKLTVAKSLVSNKGLVRTANGDNKVVLADGAKKTGDVTVQGEGKDYNSDALAEDSNKVKTLAKVVTTADGKTAASTVSGSEGVINGASVYKVENTADGIKVTESYIPENETNRAITDLAALSLITWRQENNDLNKRLGEIRDSKGDDGVWARMARGEATFKGVKNQYNYYQMGYDKKLNDNWILGGAFSYTDGDNTFHSGTGQTKNSSFAVYGSNLRDDGSFIDLIAKYAHLKNEYDTPLGIGSGDYSTNGFSFSGEYGKRFHMDKFWLEPQVELTWGHVDSVNYSTENGARVHQNGMDSFVGRLGFSLGKDFSHGNVYARASYLYDFDGDVKASMTNGTVSREYREDIGGGWFEFGVGTNLNLGSDTHFYFDLERAEGGSGNVKTPWQWNVGVRYSF